MLQTTTTAPSTPNFCVPQAKPAAPVKAKLVQYPEPSTELIEQRSFSDQLWDEYSARRTRIVRATRKARGGDRSPSVIFADATSAYRLFVAATQKLEKKIKSLPENQKTERPMVQVGWTASGPHETSFASEVVRLYDKWINQAVQDGSADRVLHFKRTKIEKLHMLKELTESVIEDQKCSGLWELRVEAKARESALGEMIREACLDVRLSTVADCREAAGFIASLSRMALASRDQYQVELLPYQIGALSRKIAARLAVLASKRGRR